MSTLTIILLAAVIIMAVCRLLQKKAENTSEKGEILPQPPREFPDITVEKPASENVYNPRYDASHIEGLPIEKDSHDGGAEQKNS